MDEAIRQPVVTYWRRCGWRSSVLNMEGTISMPELVNQIRQNVPEALSASSLEIELVITEIPQGDHAAAGPEGGLQRRPRRGGRGQDPQLDPEAAEGARFTLYFGHADVRVHGRGEDPGLLGSNT